MEVDGQEEYEVGQTFQCEEFEALHNSWEPLENILNTDSLIQ